MDPATGMMIGSAVAPIIGGILGGNAASKAADKAAKEQRAMYERNIKILEDLGVPSIEAQKIALENPEYVGDLIAETLGESRLEDISLNPELRQKQMNNLAQIEQMANQGLNTLDRINLDQIGQRTAGEEQGRQKAILQSMAERGRLDSGDQLAAQLFSNAQASQNAMLKGQEVAKMASQNRMNAINSLSNQYANMENLDYGREVQKATAADAIQQFNANTRNRAQEYNLANRQNIENQRVGMSNQQEIYNKGLQQQDFLNRKGIADSKIGLNNVQGNNLASNALAQGQGQAQMYSGIGSGIGGMFGALAKQQKPAVVARSGFGGDTPANEMDDYYMNKVI
jgi:hypothetical protein